MPPLWSSGIVLAGNKGRGCRLGNARKNGQQLIVVRVSLVTPKLSSHAVNLALGLYRLGLHTEGLHQPRGYSGQDTLARVTRVETALLRATLAGATTVRAQSAKATLV